MALRLLAFVGGGFEEAEARMVEAVRDHWLIMLAVVTVVAITGWLVATRK